MQLLSGCCGSGWFCSLFTPRPPANIWLTACSWQVGPDVKTLVPGDRVVVCFDISGCGGACFFCANKLYSSCAARCRLRVAAINLYLHTNPSACAARLAD